MPTFTWNSKTDWDNSQSLDGIVYEDLKYTDNQNEDTVKKGYFINSADPPNPYIYLPMHENYGNKARDFSGSQRDGQSTASHGAEGPLDSSVFDFNKSQYVISSPNFVNSSGGKEDSIETNTGELYKTHIFSNVGDNEFSVGGDTTVDVFILGGGGAGGGSTNNSTGSGGGGGAGGLVFKIGYSISKGDYTITVGDGGTGDQYSGEQGGDSTAFGFTAIGGGGGGRGDTTADGKDGGCGGGGGGDNGENNPGLALQPTSADGGYGHDGGKATTNAGDEGAGGGGIAQDGFNGQAYNDNPPSGPGGDGYKELTINSTLYNFGDMFGIGDSYGETINGEQWFGGGGAGHADDRGGGLIPGGKGGGGDFNDDTRAQYPGLPNTGGGGAGGGKNGERLEGEDGGSGIVMVRIGPI